MYQQLCARFLNLCSGALEDSERAAAFWSETATDLQSRFGVLALQSHEAEDLSKFISGVGFLQPISSNTVKGTGRNLREVLFKPPSEAVGRLQLLELLQYVMEKTGQRLSPRYCFV